ncbi:thiol:disulfide interchange protein DsbD [Marinilabilia salmonicolor]|jgi:thiol:disulfide interchange protein DsbD|uniref:protein-disulfide reductase DsbD family protein n=1 Tax=Marinilabilia salmonicolor TaxID=989 RepID=UPI000D04BCD3|nr:cytochrome c biogenesis protein CcdA [Marinilabilia salmonicolor]PRZ00577.1 thiol:disulfide interchange protein DsbD [Marinilabilia salmonicolor]
MKKISLIIWFSLLFSGLTLNAQILEPVKWAFSLNQLSETEYEIIADATIDEGWHLYSSNIPEGGPIATSVTLVNSGENVSAGNLREEPEADVQFDQAFDMELSWFSNEARFILPVTVTGSDVSVLEGYVEFMACDDEQCLPPDRVDFSFVLDETGEPAENVSEASGADKEEGTEADVASKDEGEVANKTGKEDQSETRGNWTIFWLSFLGGFAALLTPCVFPMIPMTVSFFTKQSKTKASGFRNAIFYGVSIIVIYVILGTVVTAVFGADVLNALSTNPWFNLFFAALLIVFAISFFGAFEIVLPNAWVSAADKGADKGGLIGIFFMAFTLALVSFSCTGPIVGTLIVQAASVGGMAPVIGMLGFSLALALPFALFAAFPGWLNSLPKSGGWLNSVKVVLGFLELAFAFKFLSITDMVWGLHVLEREVFIAIWIAIFGALGFYLMGKIRLPHDSPMDHLPVSRMMLGLVVFAFTIYMIPGLWGAPVNLISGFPPPNNYAESPYGVGNKAPGSGGGATAPLSEDMHLGPQGIPAFDDYEKALAYAKEVNKPLLLDFTGKGCTNCRKMEDAVWSDPAVKEMIANDYVLTSLYVDFREKLPEEEQYVSSVTGKKIRTIGNKWSDFQISRFQRNSQPHYVILGHDEQPLVEERGYDTDIKAYTDWLKSGLDAFRDRE